MPRRERSSETKSPPSDRRLMALVLAITMLIASLLAWWFGSGSTAEFTAAACGRIGLVMGALWLAWPSLKRPAKWLPASAPVIGVIALVVLAAQPKLIIPAIPIVGGLITVSALARAFRRK
ncbi:hypothetical protein Enr13x_63520 [Stieleria neptunia]|uniref:Uncharacterized protein n=1 Tax=Stieleria neptunia TaxID=2527979 RepID=A0A518I010_9BACT|nr:hypothetical protein [Stieleria neptunia]QDV46443.1 hypothetical protein Enr13x_63520 [Stieleria neptunia]